MQQELTRQKRYRSLLKVLKYVRHSRKRLYTRTSFIKQIKSTKVFYMYKKKSWVIKSWFMKKYRWKNRSSSNSKDWTPRDYKTYMKKDLGGCSKKEGGNYSNETQGKKISAFGSSLKNKDNRFNSISNLKRGSVSKTYRRNKVLLNSYLSGTIQKMPRFYSYKRFGKDKLTKYKTLPFKLSMSIFLANKIFRNFYSYIGKKKLLRVHKKVETKKSVLKGNQNISSIKKLRKLFIQPLNKNKNDLGLISKKIECSRNLGQKYEKANLIRIKKKWIQKSQGEKSKSFITLLEQRLDSSILRLFHFKPNLMKHSLTRRSPRVTLPSESNLVSISKDNDTGYTIRKKPKKKIRSNPLTSFTPAQIKQMISHGKIFINGKKVKSGNRQMNVLDKIEVKGFIQNLNHKKVVFSTLPKKDSQVSPLQKMRSEKGKSDLKNNFLFNSGFKKDCLSFIKKSQNFYNHKKNELALPDLLKKTDRFNSNNFESFFISSNKDKKKINSVKSGLVGSWDFSKKNPLSKTSGEDNRLTTLKQNHQRTLLLKNFKSQEYLKEIKEKSLFPSKAKTDSNFIQTSKLVENKLKISSDENSKEIHICDFLRALKLKRFTETFYTTYRNLHLFDRKVYKVLEKTPDQKKNLQKGRIAQKQASNSLDLSFNKQEPLEKLVQTFLEPKIEEETKIFFDRLGSDQSIYNLWSLSPLLKVNKWNASLKKGLSHSVFKREKTHNLRLRRKLRWLKRRGYFAGKFVKFIRNYYKTKSKVVRFIAMKDKWQKDNKRKNKESEEENQNSEKVSKATVPQHVIFLAKKHPSWINYTVSRRTRPAFHRSTDLGRKISANPLSNAGKEKNTHNLINKNLKDTRPVCYASLIYGTRSSHSVRWQQFNKNARTRLFYNRILKGGRAGGSDKFNFFELELEFVQSIYESYSGYTRS